MEYHVGSLTIQDIPQDLRVRLDELDLVPNPPTKFLHYIVKIYG